VTTESVAENKARGEKATRLNTSAVYIAEEYAGSEAWHELRRAGIGGSEIGTILGISRWESPFSLWAKKTKRIDNIVSNDAMEWGNRLEPVVLDKFQDSHPELSLHRKCGTWHAPGREWQRSNPDAIFETEDGEFGIVEVKTAMYEEDWHDGPPRNYEAQVQWYLQTFGYKRAYIVVLFHGNKYEEYEIAANEFQQETSLAAAEAFRVYLLEDRQPDFDGADATLQVVRRLNPNIDPDATEELGDLGVHYFNAVDDLNAAEAKANEMKSRVLDAMRTAKFGSVFGDVMVTRQSRGAGAPFLVNRKRGAASGNSK
jgi:putative phage-type endonuclease